MADELCGPSNPLKNLGAHVDRDRSLHQDRIGGRGAAPFGSAVGVSFRSAPAARPNLDGEVDAFLRGPVGVPTNGFTADPIPAHPAHGVMGPHSQMHGTPAPVVGAGAGMAAAVPRDWVDQFGAINLGGSARSGAEGLFGGPLGMNANTAVGPAHGFSPAYAAGSPAFLSPAEISPAFRPPVEISPAGVFSFRPGISVSMGGPVGVHGQPSFSESYAADVREPATGLTEAELDAKFAQFQAELDNDEDFQDEMDAWMRRYGPGADGKNTAAAAALRTGGLAEEADIARQHTEERHGEDREDGKDAADENDELARTAKEILHSVSNDNSEKFQRSNFLQLMRRITDGEVVLAGDDFVDQKSGRPLSHDKDHSEEAAADTPATAATPA